MAFVTLGPPAGDLCFGHPLGLLVRKRNDNDTIWRAAGVAAGKVVLTKLVLWMQVMTPSITAETPMLSFMDTGGKSLLSWLTVTTDAKEDNVNGTFKWHLASKQGVSGSGLRIPGTVY